MSHLVPATYLTYSPRVNGVQGFGQIPWGAIFTTAIGAGLTVTQIAFQERATARAERSARHEAARERQQLLDLQAAAAAQQAAAIKAATAQAAITAGATGGAVAVDAQGRLLPASGVAAPGAFAMPRGINRNMVMIGVLGVVGVGALMVIGKRG